MATQAGSGVTPTLTFASRPPQAFDEDVGLVDVDLIIHYHACRGGDVEWRLPSGDPLYAINGRIC